MSIFLRIRSTSQVLDELIRVSGDSATIGEGRFGELVHEKPAKPYFEFRSADGALALHALAHGVELNGAALQKGTNSPVCPADIVRYGDYSFRAVASSSSIEALAAHSNALESLQLLSGSPVGLARITGDGERTVALYAGRTYLVGGHPSASILINAPGIASRHLTIHASADGLLVAPNNGTVIANGGELDAQILVASKTTFKLPPSQVDIEVSTL